MPKTLRFPTVPPIWYQMPSWKASHGGKKRKITSYPRRHGKDFEDMSLAADDALRRKGTYYYVFPTRRWGERAIWETMADIGGVTKPIIDWMFPDTIAKKYKSDLRVETINGSKFFMGGTDNLDFVGQGGQGYTMSEFSLHREEATSLLAPIIRQSQAYLRLNGTMRGKENQLYKILKNTENDPEWFSTWLKPADTKLYCWVSDEHNLNPEILPLIGKINPATGELYKNCQGVPFYNIQSDIDSGLCSYTYARQEYLNEANSDVSGAYFEYEISKMHKDGRIARFGGIDSRKPLMTIWDIGGATQQSDSTTAALLQEFGNKWRIVGYYDATGNSIGRDIANIRAMSGGAKFGGHFAPHDAKKTSKQTQLDLLEYSKQEFGFEFKRVPKTQSVRRDIEICRRQFVDLEVDLDGQNVELFLEHIGRYREDPKTNRPDHKSDDSSHGGDCLRTGLMARHHKIFTPYLDSNRMFDELDEYQDGYDDGGIYLLDT